MTDPATALMMAGADARIVAATAGPLVYRITFLRSYERQVGELSTTAEDSLRHARAELYALLRGSPLGA